MFYAISIANAWNKKEINETRAKLTKQKKNKTVNYSRSLEFVNSKHENKHDPRAKWVSDELKKNKCKFTPTPYRWSFIIELKAIFK